MDKEVMDKEAEQNRLRNLADVLIHELMRCGCCTAL